MRKNATTTNGFFALGLAALLTTSLQATAATLIPAEYTLSTDAETRQENFPFTITYDFTLSNEFVEVQEVSSAETFGGVPPLAIAQADVNASNLSENNTIRPDTRAIANIFYQFGVVGTPSGSDFLYQVPVRVQAQGQADTSTDPFDTASAIAAVTIGGLQWGGRNGQLIQSP